MFADAAPTPIDVRFRLLGFPVRVHPFFWLIMAILGDQWLNTFHGFGILIWLGCAFVSILVHELGHAFAARWFGSPCRIVLHGFGGYAEYPYPPTAARDRLIIALAGPIAGFALCGLSLFVAILVEDVNSKLLTIVLIINLYWNILNLLPIFPLDGGKVLRESLVMSRAREADARTHQVSMFVAGGLAVLGILVNFAHLDITEVPVLSYVVPSMMMTFWLGMFAYMNYELMQQTRRRSPWSDPDYDDVSPWRRR